MQIPIVLVYRYFFVILPSINTMPTHAKGIQYLKHFISLYHLYVLLSGDNLGIVMWHSLEVGMSRMLSC